MDHIILVDIFDRQIGAAEKLEAHRTPCLHRAFSVFVHHDDRMLLQQRAKSKYHSGGLWANACCSHPRDGEPLPEAVRRRLGEEIGVRGIELRELYSFTYLHKFHDGLFEYEYDHVFLTEYGGELTPDPKEIEAVEWLPFGELADRLRQAPRQFAPWFLTAAPRVLEELTKR